MEAFARTVAEHLLPHLPALVPWADHEALAAAQGRFCAALLAANERLNLTGIVDAEGMAVRHVLDSLLALPVLGVHGPIVDLGSGCGVPGIPLALALPEREVVLVESRERKAEALAGLVEALGLGPRVTAVRARGEEWLAEQRAGDLVTRAVGTVSSQLQLLRPVRDRYERLVMLKGPAGRAELADARRQLAAFAPARDIHTHAASLPGEAGERLLIVIPGTPPRAARRSSKGRGRKRS